MGTPREAQRATLVGRDDEVGRLDRLIDALCVGVGGSLILVGDAGSGKTALLQYIRTVAKGDAVAVLAAQGTQGEAQLPFAGLHRLLHPVTARIEAMLAPDDATALADAMRLPASDTVDRTAVAAATLRFLHGIAADGPVLLVVDDLQWLDGESKAVLAFLIGRTEPAAIGLVAATRDETVALQLPHLPVHRLPGLDESAVQELLTNLAMAPVPAAVRNLLTSATGGNPRALAELPALLTADQLRGTTMIPDPVPLGPASDCYYAAPIRRLPEPTQRALLLAAAEPDLDAVALGRAAAILDTNVAALVAAEDAGLITIGAGGVSFRHPLTRSAAYYVASSSVRREAHDAIARACPERATVHRAATAWEPSESLAADLSDVAERTRAEQGPTAAANHMQRAAELTPSAPARARRLHAAATDAWLGGDPVRALALLEHAVSAIGGGPERDEVAMANVELLRAQIMLRCGNPTDAYETLLAAAARFEAHSIHLATRAHVAAGMSAWFAGDLQRFAEAARRAEGVVNGRADELAPTVRLGLHYLTGLAAQFAGRTEEAAGPLRTVVDDALGVDDPSALVLAASCAMVGGDRTLVHALATRGLNAARDAGAIAIVPHAIEILTLADCWSGHYPLNHRNVFEGLRIARQTGQVNSECHLLSLMAMAAAINGHSEECLAYARAADKIARTNGIGLVAATASWAIAMLDVAHARWAPAYRRLGRLYRAAPGAGHPVVGLASAAYFVEAAVAVGRTEQAHRVLNVYEHWSRTANRPGLLAITARCRALLAEGPEADAHYREAIKHHHNSDRDFERGYTELLFARHLRRGRQRAEARDQLHSALEVFERLEIDMWTKRVHAELRAIGERSPVEKQTTEQARTVHASGLTAQQLQIASLVAEGATNRDIAERMFVSTRTVDYHLRNIFQRLGINSRAELIRRFG